MGRHAGSVATVSLPETEISERLLKVAQVKEDQRVCPSAHASQ